MDPEMMLSLGQAGAAAVLGIAALGSALGTAAAGLAAVGVWKRCYAQEKPVPFILVTFIGAPLSQTIYGMILMNTIVRVASERMAAGDFVGFPAMMAAGLFGGLGMAASAYGQGRVGRRRPMPWATPARGWATTSWRSASSRPSRCSCWCSSKRRSRRPPSRVRFPAAASVRDRRRGPSDQGGRRGLDGRVRPTRP
jgi:V/A-type H+/Na+-transporting ATPase subunit K